MPYAVCRVSPTGGASGVGDARVGQQKGPVAMTGPFGSGAGGTNCTYVFLLEEGCSATELRLRGVANRSNEGVPTSKSDSPGRGPTSRPGPGGRRRLTGSEARRRADGRGRAGRGRPRERSA